MRGDSSHSVSCKPRWFSPYDAAQVTRSIEISAPSFDRRWVPFEWLANLAGNSSPSRIGPRKKYLLGRLEHGDEENSIRWIVNQRQNAEAKKSM